MPDVCLLWTLLTTERARPTFRVPLQTRKHQNPIVHLAASFPRLANNREKKLFNPHRLVPAQFNEFYPKCSGPTFPFNPNLLGRSTSDRILPINGRCALA